MPHDSTKADMWYHDTMGQFCFMVLTPHRVISMLKQPEKYSAQDCIDVLENMQKHYDAGKAMVYEQYLEMRRLENKNEA